MKIDILNKLSGLAFYGFYDPSKKMVTVHFFNEANDKPDIIAYLKRDMSWDVREIVDEVSLLRDSSEVVTILHENLGVEEFEGEFDHFVRAGLSKMAYEIHGEDANLPKLDPMFKVFEENSYDLQE